MVDSAHAKLKGDHAKLICVRWLNLFWQIDSYVNKLNQ